MRGALHARLGPLSLEHWINDGLMAGFFLLVGLEIEREALDGRLRTWSDRVLPGLAALGGIGFTMSLFIGGLAFPSAGNEAAVKLGVLAGSLLSGLVGAGVLIQVPGRAVAGPASAG